ncbi:hypothetical protein QBC34DRAFT_160610 [Podospora aff. communis PSN243]|uniref:GPI inositol-deacylase n=1 Tax=Podospora aff. communis PSN243 TaxID=3040156 RepID=A0AAV9GF40_9PEZI|nr:hypothetical protein QBC34DRAFT_160610 [Podospora aff. communis PSN243]
MNLSRKTSSFGGIFSASGADKSSRTGIVRTETANSLSISSLELADSERGPLGLTTLYDPAPVAPTADLVFVHGLGGGSRKTWSFSSDISHYWPLAWLPTDDDFADVRIHTYGYKADWGERRESVLNIHDFAQSLLGELRNHPGVRRTATRIVLVGHSMGGCVAKMTYILARQDPSAADIAARFHSIFFLGTPHHGSDMASMLENMLTVAWGKKPYVTDLVPNSRACQSINDAFRHFAPPLRLWSFFETLPVRAAGLASRVVVEKHSAILGYANEENAAMDADHRHVCKFDTPLDPNYRKLRNALVTAIDMIRSGLPLLGSNLINGKPDESNDLTGPIQLPISNSLPIAETKSRLRSFLSIRDSFEDDDLATLHVFKQPGSCQWFMERGFFSSWKVNASPGILWLVGRPATGKSVIASHVIEQLREQPKTYCSYFIYKHGEMGKSTLRDCFKSLALQMSSQDILVREALLQLAQDGLVCDMTDDGSIWRRVFTGCIFKLSSISQHCWVMDGLDECTNFNHLFTKKFLTAVPKTLRLFATSRPLQEVERGLSSLGPTRYSLQVLSDSDTVDDMRLFLSTRLEELGRPEDPEDRNKMCGKILAKSSGSFLWARLVLQEFENTWTEEAMDAALQEVPADLQDLYSRMMQTIKADTQKLQLAKSILTWVALASRPLSTLELRSAVKLDVNQTLQNVAKSVPDVCGQFVFIDKDEKVHLIHETAREFLVAEEPTATVDDALKSEEIPFVTKKEGHTRLASLLLRYLCTEGPKSQLGSAQQGSIRTRGFARTNPITAAADLSMLNYASSFFSHHLYRSTSENDGLAEELVVFLQSSTVLTWIEHAAKQGDLSDVTRTAIDIREYLARRMKYIAPTHPTVRILDQWVTDLIRVAAKFRAQLLASPSSIHHLIPPMCPSESIISRTFVKDSKRAGPNTTTLVVKGVPPGTWDDCLLRVDFQKGQTTSLSHGESLFAIGLSTGLISIYDPASVHCLRRFTHPERVKILHFGPDDVYLASCGAKHLCVWDPRSGAMTHSLPLSAPPLALSFLGKDELLCASQSSETTHWSLATEEHTTLSWKVNDDIENDGYGELPLVHDMIPSQPPGRVAFLTTDNNDIPVIMAVGYRAHPVLVWNALDLQLLGVCDPGIENNGIDSMVFNPNPEMPALVVSYQEGNLCVFDYTDMNLQTLKPQVYAHSIACSSDGRSLVTGSNQGLIEVFDFDRGNDGLITLVPIYRSSHPLDQTIRGVAFNTDGLRVIDIRGRQGRVWAPALLVRKSDSDFENSVVDSAPGDASSLLPPKPMGVVHSLANPTITSPLRATLDGRFIVAGNSSGEVILFSTADASLVSVLFQHARGTSVVDITLGEPRNMVISADDSGRILIAELSAPMSRIFEVPKPQHARTILDRRFGTAVAHLLLNACIDRLLVCGRHKDELWEIPSGKFIAERPHHETINPIDSSTDQQPSQLPSTSSTSVLTSSSGRHNSVISLGARCHSAFQHPAREEWFILAAGDTARVHAWSDFAEQTSSEGIRLERTPSQGGSVPESSGSPEPDINWQAATVSYHSGPGFIVEALKPSPSSSPSLYLWKANAFNPSSETTVVRPAAEPNLEAIRSAVLEVLGLSGPSTLVFLDTNLWICTTELQSVAAGPGSGSSPSLAIPRGRGGGGGFRSFSSARTSPLPSPRQTTLSLGQTASSAPIIHARRHFFALSEWQREGTRGKLKCTLAISHAPQLDGRPTPLGGGGSRDVVFATGHHLIVIKGGFDFFENLRASAVPAADPGHTLQIVGGMGNQGPISPTASVGGQYVWDVVSGSMQRKLLNR